MSATLPPVLWEVSSSPVPYLEAVQHMQDYIALMQQGMAPEKIWLLEHPPLYTAGTSARTGDLIDAHFPVYESERGGQYTYHGPGQRIVYVMLDLSYRKKDVRAYVAQLEQWIMDTLRAFQIHGERRCGRIGVWVCGEKQTEEKIAAIGVRIRRWITYHGIAINVCPDLTHYSGIVPCGIKEYGVTSMKKLGIQASMNELDGALKKNCPFLPIQF